AVSRPIPLVAPVTRTIFPRIARLPESMRHGELILAPKTQMAVEPVHDTAEYRKNLRAEIEDRIRRGVSAPGESPDRPPSIPELNSARRMEKIAVALKAKGYSDSVIAKVCGGNFERALGEIWV